MKKSVIIITVLILQMQSQAQNTYSPVRKEITSDVVNNNASANTLQDVTGLNFQVVAGQMYTFEFIIVYTSQATTTGSRWSINGPTQNLLHYRSEYTLTATSRTFNEGLTGYNVPAAANASSLTTSNMAVITGVIRATANGTVTARFASEVSNSAITAKAGSYVEFKIIN